MNLANKITMFRIILIPIFIVLLFYKSGAADVMALIVYVIASVSDSIDGHIARKYNMITDFGKFADPLADKLLVLSSFVAFVELGEVKSWIVIIIIARELLITGFRTIAVSKGISLAANNWGKIKTVAQMITIIVILSIRAGINIPFFAASVNVLLGVTLVLTVMSGYIYIIDNKSVLK